jgi:hypothetical protein
MASVTVRVQQLKSETRAFDDMRFSVRVNGTRALIASAFLVAVAMLLVQRRSISQLRAEIRSLREQYAKSTQPEPEERERLLPTDRQRAEQPGLKEQSSEVHRLRGEVGPLRREVEKLTRSKAEIEQGLIVAMDWAKRKRQLQEWLQHQPSENTPDLRYVTSDDWVRAVLFNPLKTEEDYRRAMSLMRANGSGRYLNQLYPAVGQYAQAHNGQFPTEATQLQPYFNDEALLASFQVLPASKLRGLINDEEIAGFGEWVLTQRAPVNEEWDDRWFVGLTNLLGTTRTSAPNRWGSTPR